MVDLRYNNKQANNHRGWLREIGKVPTQNAGARVRRPPGLVPVQRGAVPARESRQVVLRDSVSAVLNHAFGVGAKAPPMVAYYYRNTYPELYEWVVKREQ